MVCSVLKHVSCVVGARLYSENRICFGESCGLLKSGRSTCEAQDSRPPVSVERETFFGGGCNTLHQPYYDRMLWNVSVLLQKNHASVSEFATHCFWDFRRTTPRSARCFRVRVVARTILPRVHPFLNIGAFVAVVRRRRRPRNDRETISVVVHPRNLCELFLRVKVGRNVLSVSRPRGFAGA